MKKQIKYQREVVEFALILMVSWLFYCLKDDGYKPLMLLVVVWAFAKSIYFIFENSVHLLKATAQNIPYHKFLFLMTYNIGQMTLSFALDFFNINEIDGKSFTGVNTAFNVFERLFEFFYFSVLNFTFFGYGELMPANIPAKMILLFEVIIAFLTVIFILSDFISMKESLKKK